MQTDLRLLLLIVSMVLGSFIVFKAFRDRRLKKPPAIRHHIEKTLLEDTHTTEELSSGENLQLGESDPLLEDYEYKSIPIDTENPPTAELLDNLPIDEPRFNPEIITLSLIPRDSYEFEGEELLEVFQIQNYHYGKMNIFHCHENEDPEQPIIYSIASLVEPGTFDYNAMHNGSYRGIVFWMVVQDSSGYELFEKMLDDTKHLADMLNGIVCDDKRQQLTLQKINNIRIRIRDPRVAQAS